MRDLKNFKPTKKEEVKKQDKFDSKEKVDEEDVKRMIDERSSKSEEELMNELKEEVKKSKTEGKFTDKDVENFKKTVLPFLNDEQKRKLDEIIKIIT